MTRFGKRVGVLVSLRIEYPVGRDGARFEAMLASDDLRIYDTSQLRFFVVQDDAGEGCDDGNHKNLDGCTATCKIEAPK